MRILIYNKKVNTGVIFLWLLTFGFPKVAQAGCRVSVSKGVTMF